MVLNWEAGVRVRERKIPESNKSEQSRAGEELAGTSILGF